MKKMFVLAVALIASPAFADDSIPQNVLQSLGLGDIQQMTAAEGRQIRGSATAVASSLSTVSGVLFDTRTNSFVNFAGADYAHVFDDAMAPQALANTGVALNPVLTTDIGGVIHTVSLTLNLEGLSLARGNSAVTLAAPLGAFPFIP